MLRSLVPVQVGGAWIALDAECLQEILGERAWFPIPGASEYLPGVLAWRGRAVALLDLGIVCATPQPLDGGSRRRRTLIVHSQGSTLALPVDAVREVQQVGEERVKAAHVTRQRFSSVEVELLDTLMPLLDLEGLVREVVTAGETQ